MAAKYWRSGAGNGLRALASSSLSKATKSASIHTIQAIPREVTGTRKAERDRCQGRIPGMVYHQILHETSACNRDPMSSKTTLFTTEDKQIQEILNSVTLPFFCSTRIPFEIRAGSGSSVLLDSGIVLPTKVHRDEQTKNILNLVFVWANDGTKLKVDVPVVLKGVDVCPGLNKGGHLKKIIKSIRYLCPAELIPQKIEVDVSNLDIGEDIFIPDIEVDPSLTLLSKRVKTPICKIVSTNAEIPEPAADDLVTEV